LLADAYALRRDDLSERTEAARLAIARLAPSKFT
jgi:hypothetical protein